MLSAYRLGIQVGEMNSNHVRGHMEITTQTSYDWPKLDRSDIARERHCLGEFKQEKSIYFEKDEKNFNDT